MSVYNEAADSVWYERLCSIYREKIQAKSQSHVCNLSCKFTILTGKVFSISETQNHLCSQWCIDHPSWCSDSNCVLYIKNLFICELGGNKHICTETCEHLVRVDGAVVCTLSGLHVSRPTWVNNFNSANEYHRSGQNKVRFCNQKVKTACRILLSKLLFGPVRLMSERKRIFQFHSSLYKLWHHMRRRCQREKVLPNYINMLQRGVDIFSAAPFEIYVYPNSDIQEKILDFYCNRVSRFQTLLNQYTDYKLSSAPMFCASVIYLMRYGLVVHNIPVLPKDHYLSTMLPESNSLNDYQITKTHFSSTSTEIYGAIYRAVTWDSINPQTLAMHCCN